MIKKGIVLAAGKGTRLRPLTHAVPKEMLRVGEKPAIHHGINLLKRGGVKEVLVIVGRKKMSIVDYLGSGDKLGVDVYYRVQEEPRGTADAVSLGEDFIGEGEDFIVMYGDNYLKPYDKMSEIVEFHEEEDCDGTMVAHLEEDPRRLGVIDVDENDRISKIVQKPSMEEAEPYKVDGKFLATTGVMILNSKVFEFVEKTKPGKNDEVWLADSIRLMMDGGYDFCAYNFEGTRFDVGTFDSLEEADELEQKIGYEKREK